jgi:uncharacterized protein YgiM (DUF1202 family)
MKRTWLAAFAGLVMIFASSTVDAAFVSGSSLNCRAEPDRQAEVLGRFTRGTQLEVLERRDGWGRIEADGTPSCWVSEQFLSEEPIPEESAQAEEALRPSFEVAADPEPRASTSRHTSSQRQATARSSESRPRGSSRAAPRSRPSVGGACPCGSGRVCVGPRGGRYCLNSTGTRRYGQ